MNAISKLANDNLLQSTPLQSTTLYQPRASRAARLSILNLSESILATIQSAPVHTNRRAKPSPIYPDDLPHLSGTILPTFRLNAIRPNRRSYPN